MSAEYGKEYSSITEGITHINAFRAKKACKLLFKKKTLSNSYDKKSYKVLNAFANAKIYPLYMIAINIVATLIATTVSYYNRDLVIVACLTLALKGVFVITAAIAIFHVFRFAFGKFYGIESMVMSNNAKLYTVKYGPERIKFIILNIFVIFLGYLASASVGYDIFIFISDNHNPNGPLPVAFYLIASSIASKSEKLFFHVCEDRITNLFLIEEQYSRNENECKKQEQSLI